MRFTWKAQTAPEVGWTGASSKARIKDVEAIDPRTVAFHFDRAYPEMLADAFEGGIVPEHVFGKIPFDRWRTHDWSQVKIGSGPFVLESWRPGEEIVLAKNPRYLHADRPFVEKVVVRVVPDVGNLETQLAAGTIDYVEGVPPQDARRLADDAGDLAPHVRQPDVRLRRMERREEAVRRSRRAARPDAGDRQERDRRGSALRLRPRQHGAAPFDVVGRRPRRSPPSRTIPTRRGASWRPRDTTTSTR